VAGHGDPGTLADVRAQRTQLESQFQHARECFEQGMSYDGALQPLPTMTFPLDFQRMIILPATANSPASARKRRPCQSEPHDPAAGHRHRGQAAAGQERVKIKARV